MQKTKFSWWKFIVGYILYVFFHEIYDLTGGNVLGVILGEGIESIYAHMKMLFYAYLLVALIDYFIRRKEIELEKFLYARMLILAAVPWMMIIMYYAVEASGIHLPRIADLSLALFATALGIYFSIRLEEPFEAMPLRGSLKAMIALAFVTALITYVGFSFQVPDNFFLAVD
ncbi:MAG: hypothetical protein Kow002_13130 [Anaerolineales bacterium]